MKAPRDSERAGAGESLAPGLTRWIGWISLAAALVLGALWATRAGTPREAEADDMVDEVELPETLEGFRADAWYLPDDSLLGFVEIPAGPVVVGSDPVHDPAAYDVERWSPEQARDTLRLERFYLGRYEVTVAQFRAFVEARDATVPAETVRGPLDHPVTHVTWPDAVAFARWLDEELRSSDRTPAPLRRLLEEGWRVTLPSEVQWEKGARGTDDRIFPWGEAPRGDRANFGRRSTTPVGSFPCPECPWGLADMSGNVWEWTRSPYQPYPYDETDDRETLTSDALWVMRGGSFQDPPQNVRAAVRGGGDPGARRPFIGFRVAITPP